MAAAKKAPQGADAAALIAAAKGRTARPDPSPAALAELRKVLAHNDAAPWGRKVPATAALDLLSSHGWDGGRFALDNLCKRLLGRKSYGTP